MKFIGILGFGKLGEFLYNKIQLSNEYKISFIWNRSPSKLVGKIPEDLILRDIKDIKKRKCDLVVEVSHPHVVQEYGELILQSCDLMVGSPTVFADTDFRETLLESATLHAIYIPTGALWGLEDIRKLEECKQLKSLKITMEKHPFSFKLVGPLEEFKEASQQSDLPTTIFNGSVKELSKIAPNNVNTMAVAALTADSLGFEKVKGCLISNPRNDKCHTVTIELETLSGLKVVTTRINPAAVGDVTGSATLMSFFQSVKRATGANSGLNFC